MDTFEKEYVPQGQELGPATETASSEPVAGKAAGQPSRAEGDGASSPGDLAPLRPEDVPALLKQLETRLAQAEQEAQEYRRILHSLSVDNQWRREQADAASFLEEMRASFPKDPVETIRKMILRAQEESWQATRELVNRALDARRAARTAMEELAQSPDGTNLAAFEEEVEFLIHDLGLPPQFAVKLIRHIVGKHQSQAAQRAVAARAVRNRAAVETAGDVDEPQGADHELDRALKKAKNLDELFENLNRIKL